MPCKITFILDKGKVKVKTEWDNQLKNFCNFLLGLQEGEYFEEIVDAIKVNGKDTKDIKKAKKIIGALLEGQDYMNSPIVTPDEIGEDIYFEDK